jgi:hypothetical protein
MTLREAAQQALISMGNARDWIYLSPEEPRLDCDEQVAELNNAIKALRAALEQQEHGERNT